MDALVLGATIGLAAGLSPGPLLFLTITSTLRSGARAGTVVACAPLFSDAVVVAVTVGAAGQLPHTWLAVIGVVGGLFLGLLAWRTWREAGTASLAQARAQSGPPRARALREAVAANLLSPHPWLAWSTALAPLTVRSWRADQLSGVLFVLAFYALLVGAKIAVALLTGRGRHRLTDRGYRIALRAAAVALAATGVALLLEFGLSLG